MPKPPAGLPLFSQPPAAPRAALGGLYLAPQKQPFVPLRKWPRAAQLAELARIDRQLAALADPERATATAAAVLDRELAGGTLRDPALARRIAERALEKYRRRLLRALGRR